MENCLWRALLDVLSAIEQRGLAFKHTHIFVRPGCDRLIRFRCELIDNLVHMLRDTLGEAMEVLQ